MDSGMHIDLHDDPVIATQSLSHQNVQANTINQFPYTDTNQTTSQLRINALRDEACEARPLNQRDKNLLALQPHFLKSLYKILEEKDFAFWNHTGAAFFIYKPLEFAIEVLPFYFKHHNLNSFIRQLNVYGFKKIKMTEDHNELLCYQHELFQANEMQGRVQQQNQDQLDQEECQCRGASLRIAPIFRDEKQTLSKKQKRLLREKLRGFYSREHGLKSNLARRRTRKNEGRTHSRSYGYHLLERKSRIGRKKSRKVNRES